MPSQRGELQAALAEVSQIGARLRLQRSGAGDDGLWSAGCSVHPVQGRMVNPLSTTNSAPVTKRDSSLAR